MTDADVIEAAAMLAAGMTQIVVAKHFGVSQSTLQTRTNPKARERRRNYDKAERSIMKDTLARAHPHTEANFFRLSPDEVRRLRESLPEDRRSLTARLMGDPIPNDHRRQA